MGKRAIVVVIDALGVGALPDAAHYADAPGANTLGNIDRTVPTMKLPNLEKLGAGHILPLQSAQAIANPVGFYGKMAEQSQGKDTTTGHWEMIGIALETPFPTYPDGFPQDVIDQFIEKSGCKGILGNIPASGTEIIENLGAEHLAKGYPIVYTSADSVFQIACHVEKIPLKTLYQWCEVARELLQGEHQVSRVIARPFLGEPGKFERLGGDRRDYAVTPPAQNVLSEIVAAKGVVFAVGKIEDIFCQVGVTHAIHTQNNTHGINITTQAIENNFPVKDYPLPGFQNEALDWDKQLIFVNLVDTDMKYGHRRDPQGYANALMEIDAALDRWMAAMGPDDMLMITGDHGCDPTAPGSDHTREYVPLLAYSPSLPGGNVGTRASFADLGQTVLDWLNIQPKQSMLGQSFLSKVN